MEDLIDALQKWPRRNNTETITEQHKKPKKHLFTLKEEKPTPNCLFCRQLYRSKGVKGQEEVLHRSQLLF